MAPRLCINVDIYYDINDNIFANFDPNVDTSIISIDDTKDIHEKKDAIK